MNWKILFVSAIAVIAVIVLGSLQIIGVSLATILSLIIGVIGIILPILNDLRKPKISLQIEQPELERKEYGDYQGYKMVTQVTNKGNKIVFNLEASAKFREQIEVSNVHMRVTNNRTTYSSSNQPFEEDNYSWIDNNGRPVGNTVNQLRKNDSMKLMFPAEGRSGLGWVIGSTSGGRTFSSSYGNDALLNLESQKTYKVEIELKGEDNDKSTVIKKKEFKIKFDE